jgi:hypothetical protein
MFARLGPIPAELLRIQIFWIVTPCLGEWVWSSESGLLGVVFWEWSFGSGLLGVVFWEWSSGSGLFGVVFLEWSFWSGLLGVVFWEWSGRGASEDNLKMEARHSTETLKPTLLRKMKL